MLDLLGGGSILATPLLLYVVGVTQPHIAIGTGALAVSLNACTNFATTRSRSRLVALRSRLLRARRPRRLQPGQGRWKGTA
ncbi:hypothetical protein EV132_101587 [Rhizobium sullae]|uniref:Uncharacterized protein n=1 Tax=Rhizobium sullae TaxID=50338 RepID=A0A4R3QFP2_RHISU|nr:hypothetical protein EV132_101587 [Rhizobium sullae]